MKLTDVTIRNLPAPPEGFKIYADDQITGFGVRVTTAGAKAFVLTYGRHRERVTIGRYPVISLLDARTEAKRILAERTLGKLRPKRLTFEEALTLFIETRKQKNRPRTARETEKLLRGYFKKLHPMHLEDIAAHHVAEITDKLSKLNLQSTAAHAHTAVKTFLKWCAQRRYLTSSPISELEKPALPQSRARVLTDAELRAVWKAADALGGNFGTIAKLLILTGQRRGEMGSLQTSWCSLLPSKDGGKDFPPAPILVGGEDNFSSAGWYQGEADCELAPRPSMPEREVTHDAVTIGSRCQSTICLPTEYTKNKRQHSFPISKLATSILRSSHTSALASGATYLFPARGKQDASFNGWSKGKVQLDKKIVDICSVNVNQLASSYTSWTLHDLRRTYATNLQRLGIKLEVIEALLNHVSGSRAGIVGVYQKYSFWDEMVEAVDAYDAWFNRTILKRGDTRKEE